MIKLNEKETKFLIKLIKKGEKTRRECVDALKANFGRTINTRNLSHFARRHNLFFKDVQPDAWTEREEQILRGLWLVDANLRRRVQELPSRTTKAMQRKLQDMKLKGRLTKELKMNINKQLRKRSVTPTQISKKHEIAEKFVKEISDKVNKTTIEFQDLKRWEKQDVESLFDLVIAKQEQQKKLETEQQSADIQIKTNAKYIALTVLSDLHLENLNTDLIQMRADFKTLKETPNFFAGFNGDLIDNFAAGPHKEGINEAQLPAKEARMLAGKLFESVKDKMLWMVLGCHDAWDKDGSDYDLPQHIARKLDVPYLGAGGDINLKINNVEYMIHSRHKYRGSSGLINGTGCCKKILTEIDPKFDIVAVSHNHFSEIKTEFYLGKQRCYIRTGSYKREDRYSKRIGFRGNPFNIQIPVVILNTETKEMKVVSGISNAADILKALNSSKISKKQ